MVSPGKTSDERGATVPFTVVDPLTYSIAPGPAPISEAGSIEINTQGKILSNAKRFMANLRKIFGSWYSDCNLQSSNPWTEDEEKSKCTCGIMGKHVRPESNEIGSTAQAT